MNAMTITTFVIDDHAPLSGSDAYQPWSRRTARAVIVQDGHVVFSFLKNRNQYVLPGGGIDPGESISACAKRECLEELGMIVTIGEPIAVVKEYYDDILRFEHFYVLGTTGEERAPAAFTEDEVAQGLTEQWIPLSSVQETLRKTQPHLMPNEYQSPHVQRAIANCHLRELLGIATCLGWDIEPIIADGETTGVISVSVMDATVDTELR